MAMQKLIRLSGLALLLGGMVSAIATLLHPNSFALNAVFDSLWVPAHVAEGLASLLTVLGLVGLHLRQAEKVGRLGLIGFILALFGSAATSNVALLFEAYTLPYIAAKQAAPKSAMDLLDLAGPLAGPLAGALLVYTVSPVVFGLGIILTGIATIRADVLPGWAGWLLIGGIVLTSVGLLIPSSWIVFKGSGVIFGVGMAGLGYALWSEKGEWVVQQRPAT